MKGVEILTWANFLPPLLTTWRWPRYGLVELEDRDLAALHLDLAAEYSEDELDSASSNRDTML